MLSPMWELARWQAAVASRRDVPVVPIVMPIKPSSAGGSGTFLALGADHQQWWVKPLNNKQGTTVVATEYIVGQIGQWLTAPVCRSAVIEIPPDLAGWAFRGDSVLEPGLAHGSLALGDAIEMRAVNFVDRDDNHRRYTALSVLYDLCWGGDPQWLVAASDEYRVYSHDHGWYFPDTGPQWNPAAMLSQTATSHPLPDPTQHLRRLHYAELERLEARLATFTSETVSDIVRSVPVVWPVSSDDLARVGYFLERRIVTVLADIQRWRKEAR